MGLRYRLFLWVSGLFLVVAACSYVIENRITARELKVAQRQVRAKILDMSKEQQAKLQGFVAESIAEDLVRIDAILHNILRFSPVALRFSPITVNEERGTWGEAADLLEEYKGIDFLQNTAEHAVVAMMTPDEAGSKAIYAVPIGADSFWVYLEGRSIPYLGITVPYVLTTQENSQEKLEKVPGEVPALVLLFDPEALEKETVLMDRQWGLIPIKWTEGYAINVEGFVQSVRWVKEQMAKGSLSTPSLSWAEISQRLSEAKEGLNDSGSLSFLHGLPKEQMMQERLQTIGVEYTQMNLIWLWMAMFDSGVLGPSLFSPAAPLGIGLFNAQTNLGLGIEGDRVFMPSAIFNDEAYYTAHIHNVQGPGIANSFAVIPADGKLFLGNTAQFVVDVGSKEKKGYLTLGMNTEALLQRLVLAAGQAALLVHHDKVFGAYFADGQEMVSDFPDVATMQQNRSGLISWKQESYFYMHLQPFADQDLHLFLLNPEAKAFALLRDLENGAQSVASAILFNIHLTGLIVLLIVILILHNISRKITRPIVELAEATQHVAAGHYDQIILQGHQWGHRDEISQLYTAFERMIVGLQEKEKVKGVLNKVVSSEIAQEILKGAIHLGGEEKQVSVLFADIRGFTHMTQHLAAKEVIEMLNECMTKLSKTVDQHHGVIDKYVGDEVMALFGAPLAREGDTLNAIKSALEMIRVLKEWNEQRSLSGLVPIEVGIGIHTGVVCAGNMGAENRLNYTVIGRNVNLAARLCGCAKPMQILVTEATLAVVRSEVVYEALEPIRFKGFDDPMPVYAIVALKG